MKNIYFIIFALLIILLNRIVPTNLISKIISIIIFYILKTKTQKNKPTIKEITLQLLTIITYITVSTLLIIILSNKINIYTSKIIIEIVLFIIIQKIKTRW